jgi:predicted amidohydrolase YtcJ
VLTRVGSDAEVLALRGPDTQVVDAGGRRVIPGLDDSHLHATRAARSWNSELRFDGVPTLAEALGRVRAQAARTPPGQWVRVVGGWSPHQFAERRLPTPEDLESAAPGRPVLVLYLYSRAFVSRAGVAALGLGRALLPPGTAIERDAEREPTGVILADPHPALLDQSVDRLPALSPEEQLDSARRFFRELARLGVTSASDAGGGGHRWPEDYAAARSLAERGELPLRISCFLFPQRPGKELEDFEGWTASETLGRDLDPRGGGRFSVRGAGELLAASANDFESFLSPRPELAAGMEADLEAVLSLLVAKRWPFRIHATYDESISRILDVVERVDARTPLAGLRFVIDHAETVSAANLARLRALGGGVAIQARMAYAGEEFAARYGAEAAAHAPPLREMLRQGIPLGAGTDGTRVASYDPWRALHWMVSGRTLGGLELMPAGARLSRAEALALYTAGSAWVAGEETRRGRLRAGQLADFAILSRDYLSVPEEKIPQIESLLTVVGGEPVYGAGEYAALAPPPLAEPLPAWSPVARYPGAWRESAAERVDEGRGR